MRFQTIGCVTAMLLAVGAAAPASAQDAKAQEILARTRDALGGTKLAGLKTLSVEATLQRNVGELQMSSQAELAIELPDKYLRTEEQRVGPGIAMATGFNGEQLITPGGGAMTMAPGGAMVFRIGPGGPVQMPGDKPSPEQLAEMNKAALRTHKSEISRLMLGWFGMTHPALPVEYTYVGEAESPDGKAYVIDAKDGDGFSARLFIDQNNHLPLMVSYQGRQPRVMTSSSGPMVTTRTTGGQTTQHRPATPPSEEERKRMQAEADKLRETIQQQPMVEISLFFDDWRDVDGIQFPHVMRRAAEGSTNEEWTITKVKVNPRFDAKKFAVESK